MPRNKTDRIKKIADEIQNLTRSPLFDYRNLHGYKPVIGEGNLNASILFIGEAPGENEAKSGRPFCGRSGRILDEFLLCIGLDRDSVYITNIVNDRPPRNRDPKSEELALYAPFLDRQIEIIEPKVIVTLGRFSMSYILNRYANIEKPDTISAIHGKVFKVAFPYGDVNVIPLFHPAVAIYNQKSKLELLEDFKGLKKFI